MIIIFKREEQINSKQHTEEDDPLKQSIKEKSLVDTLMPYTIHSLFLFIKFKIILFELN